MKVNIQINFTKNTPEPVAPNRLGTEHLTLQADGYEVDNDFVVVTMSDGTKRVLVLPYVEGDPEGSHRVPYTNGDVDTDAIFIIGSDGAYEDHYTCEDIQSAIERTNGSSLMSTEDAIESPKNPYPLIEGTLSVTTCSVSQGAAHYNLVLNIGGVVFTSDEVKLESAEYNIVFGRTPDGQ